MTRFRQVGPVRWRRGHRSGGSMSEAPSQSERRPYTSTLRERQVAQTRELILDAVTSLLGDRRADEVTTRAIAAEAGVSERTVYRHFPD
ncbi:MAG: TetR/AcrR family transcriptional regulator, partial [Actinobacteria bacterium]